jgi:hypothetical protein
MPAAPGAVVSHPGFAPQPVAHATPGGQAFAAPPAPVPAAARGGGKGLIIGLAATAGVLGIAALVIMAREMRPKEDIAVTSPITTATTAAPTVVPLPPEKPVEPPPSKDKDKDDKDDKDDVPTAGKAGGAANASTKKPATPPASSPATPPPPAITGDAACAEAKRVAENGDAAGAARVFGGCSNGGSPAAVSAAKRAIERAAPEAVRRRIFNGDCAGARTLLATLNGIGAAGTSAAVLDGATQCKK